MTARQFFLLMRGVGNGGYSETTHWSLHSALNLAKAKAESMVTPEERSGMDAINEWQDSYEGNGTIEFRTGNWGYVVYTVRPLPLTD